jgi:hypothetical protein
VTMFIVPLIERRIWIPARARPVLACCVLRFVLRTLATPVIEKLQGFGNRDSRTGLV